jgi:ElaB/YqjD/DUF883 family membrane-anchored ribosome-binding protein
MNDNVATSGRNGSYTGSAAEQDGSNSRIGKVATSAKDQAGKLYGGAQGKVQGAWATVKQEANDKPFAAVVGAAAVGAGLGWLIPSGRRETEMMAEVAHKVTDAARDAANTAVEVGRSQVDNLTQNALASVGGAVVNAVVSGDQSKTQ